MIKKILSIDKKGRLFMNIKDKRKTSEILKDEVKRCCPPHKLPHKIFGKKITDEPCRIHEAYFRNLHHTTFCKMLKCPHYKDMKKAKKKSLK